MGELSKRAKSRHFFIRNDLVEYLDRESARREVTRRQVLEEGLVLHRARLQALGDEYFKTTVGRIYADTDPEGPGWDADQAEAAGQEDVHSAPGV